MVTLMLLKDIKPKHQADAAIGDTDVNIHKTCEISSIYVCLICRDSDTGALPERWPTSSIG